MAFITLFSAARFFRRFSHYKYFTQFPGLELERLFDQLFEAELRVVERRERLEQVGQGLIGLMAASEGVTPPSGALELACSCEQQWFVDMVLYGLKLSEDAYMRDAVALVDEGPARAALARHGAAIFVVPHMGPHLITPFVLARHGFVTALTGGYDDEDTEGGFELASHHHLPLDRSHALPLGPDFAMRCVGQLARGVSLIIYPEYSKADRIGALRTSFLGARVHVPTGAARLALAARKPLISLHWEPRGPHRYALRFGTIVEPEALQKPGGVDEAMLDNFAALEGLVRAAPSSWEGWHYFRRMIANGSAT